MTGNARPNAAVIPNRENALRRESNSCSNFSVIGPSLSWRERQQPVQLDQTSCVVLAPLDRGPSIARYLILFLSMFASMRYRYSAAGACRAKSDFHRSRRCLVLHMSTSTGKVEIAFAAHSSYFDSRRACAKDPRSVLGVFNWSAAFGEFNQRRFCLYAKC